MADRKRPVHGVREKVNSPTIVFITVCTKGRQCLLDNTQAHKALVTAWSTADAWLVGRYTILPDHVHLFAAPQRDFELIAWIRFWKSQFTRQFGAAVWQSDFWDRQLRTGESYEEKWHYVANNPVRHGLVAQATDWPYQGELHPLPWP